jgi:branched-chain amino acid transport system substrate-binding protein
VLKGKKLRFYFKDDEGNSARAKVVTEKLITGDKVPIIMGGYGSAEVFAIAVTTAQYGTPFLSPGGAADEITQKGWKNVFRLNQPASEYCSGFQDFMLKIVNPTSMVILFEDTLFGPSTAKAMREWCQENNVKVLMFEPYEARNVDFKPLMIRVKASKPEVIFMVSYITDAILLTRQSAELDIDCKLFCGAAAGFVMPEYLAMLGKLGEAVMSAVLWSPDVKYPGAQKFYENFKNKFKLVPTYHAAEAYSAAYVMQDVLERTKSLSKEDLIKALSETDMMTVFGPVKFANYKKFTNQNRVPSLLVQVINGKHETIWPLEAAAAQYVYPQPKWKDKR